MTTPDAMREVVAGIEVFFFGREAGPAAPLVFVTHGRGGRVADVFPLCRDLAREGLIAAAVEQRNHGRPQVGPLPTGNWGPRFAADIYGLIVGTAMDVSLLIDLIPARLGSPPRGWA